MGVYQGEQSLALSAKSAYHQAVAGGYTGSEEDFNRALAAVGTKEVVNASDVVFDGTESGMEATDVESAITELFTDVSNGKQLVASAITDKGVETAQDATYQTMADHIAAIETGIDTSDATAEASNIDAGKTAYVNGERVIGTSTKLDTSAATVEAADILADKVAYGADGAITGAMPTVSVQAPSGTVDSNGLITVTSSQEAGYCPGGSQTKTWQLSTQEAKTYTPSTANQTISAGRYLTGDQTILGDANLVADNIKSGVSIFGVSGSLEALSYTKCKLTVQNYSSSYGAYIFYQKAPMGDIVVGVVDSGQDSTTITTYVGAIVCFTEDGGDGYVCIVTSQCSGCTQLGPKSINSVGVQTTDATAYVRINVDIL